MVLSSASATTIIHTWGILLMQLKIPRVVHVVTDDQIKIKNFVNLLNNMVLKIGIPLIKNSKEDQVCIM